MKNLYEEQLALNYSIVRYGRSRKLKKNNDLKEHNVYSILPLFIREKLGTSKIDCHGKILKTPRLFLFSSGKQSMTASCLICSVAF